MTRQEMFNLAVRGLRSQGFERAADDHAIGGSTCVYQTKDGKRCAWGWIDRTLTNEGGRVDVLRIRGIGLAATLSEDDVVWASELQTVHDCSKSPDGMLKALRAFAVASELTFPEN